MYDRDSRWTMGQRFSRWSLAVLALGALVLAPVTRAEDLPAASEARAVRLSSVEGSVRILQDGQLLTDQALANTPLFAGAQILTGEDGRAELQFDDGALARITPNSSLTLTALDGVTGNGQAEVRLDGGLGYFEAPGSDAHLKVRFADNAATPSGAAVLRINLDTPPGEVAVLSGSVHLDHAATALADLHGGQSLTLNAAAPADFKLADAIEPDSWDAWNADCDQDLAAEAATRTPAAKDLPNGNNPAWADLDASGSWYNVPDQGLVWTPNEAANPDWEPYGNGYWMMTPRYGYIWVSGDAWGYLPFQCGAWDFYDGFGWGWAPGGCRFWWGGGVWFSTYHRGGWGSRPPHRPQPPHPHLGHAENRVIAVNERPAGHIGEISLRDRRTPVTIAGHMVQPLSPVGARPGTTRPGYDRPIYDRPVYGAANRTQIAPAPGQRTVYGSSRLGSTPSGNSSQHGASSGHSTSGSSSSSHSSSSGHSSGGGGGGSHSSGGGGGGHK